MDLTVLGSSSHGNSYVLSNDTEALIIECGVSLKEVKKALDFNISKIVGALVSHEHGDHASHIQEFIDSRIKVYMSDGTSNALIECEKIKKYFPFIITLSSGYKQTLGNFTILPFDVKHDAAEPLGFFIHHPESGNVLFVTDSYYIPYKFDNLNNIMIECNYRIDLLQKNIDAGKIPTRMKDRTLQSHMSFETCKEALQANDLRAVNNIVLLHLSDGNSNEKEFSDEIRKATRKNVYVADKGLKIKFNKTPF